MQALKSDLSHRYPEIELIVQDDYQQWELSPYAPYKPAPTVKQILPFSGTSAYADEFHAHPLQSPEAIRGMSKDPRREHFPIRALL